MSSRRNLPTRILVLAGSDCGHIQSFHSLWVKTAGESLVVVRFADPRGINFSCLTRMIHNSYMSRANFIVVPSEKMGRAL